MPRFGITNIEYSSTPRQSNASVQAYSFSQHRAPTVALEVGVEKRFPAMLLRFWSLAGYSRGFNAIDRQTQMANYRAGVDNRVQIYSGKNVQFGVVGFAQLEQWSISRIKSSEDDVQRVSRLNLSPGFVGGGFIVSW